LFVSYLHAASAAAACYAGIVTS